MHLRSYAVAGIGAALAVAGCGSSSKTTSSGGAANREPGIASNASAVSSATQGQGPSGLTLRSSQYGKVIFASNNRVLYLFGADHSGTSTCYGVCASAWPPLLSKGTVPSVGPGLNARLLGTTRRTDGSFQVTYAGHPLYRFVQDTKPGQANGQGLDVYGAEWYVLSPAGTKVER